jgi:hypothetical protein
MEIQAKAFLRPKGRPREVCIVGFGPGMDLMYQLDSHVPIWSMNAAESYDFRRLDALFEMHPIRDIVLETRRIRNLRQEHPYPIYMLDKYPWFPSSVRYPKEEVISKVFENVFLGPKNARYMDSSVPYMVALAVHKKFNVIYLFGFGLMTDTEYVYQRPGAFGLIMWAAAQGVKVILPEDSNLMPETLYGYDDYQSISRQNCEQWLQDMQIQESDWIGKVNLFQERVVQMERLGAPKEELEKAREDRLNAYQQMYMRQGAIHMLMQQIQIMDRKRDALAEFVFTDHLFVKGEGEEVKTKQQALQK